jgi:hypothetical protein
MCTSRDVLCSYMCSSCCFMCSDRVIVRTSRDQLWLCSSSPPPDAKALHAQVQALPSFVLRQRLRHDLLCSKLRCSCRHLVCSKLCRSCHILCTNLCRSSYELLQLIVEDV